MAILWEEWNRVKMCPDLLLCEMHLVSVEINLERPDCQEAARLLNELDDYLIVLYPPESNHLLSVSDLLKPEVRFVIARINGIAAGCGALLIKPGYGEIKRMYVRPDRRRTGVGRGIIEKLCTIARESGLKKVKLETGIFQTSAIGLYERSGFKRIGPFGEYKEDPLSVFYELTL